MSPRWRQIFAATTVTVFVVVAAIVGVRAGGWQWAGWRQGFVPSGVIVVSSSPHATILLNGRAVGMTPRRLASLVPGVYTLELQGPGTSPWKQTIQVNPRVAEVIGPVILLPSHIKRKDLAPGAAASFITDTSRRIVFSTEDTATGVVLTEAWPEQEALTLTASSRPAEVSVSPHQQLAALSNQTETIVLPSRGLDETWTIPRLEGIFWLPGSDQVAYGRRNGRLLRLDEVTKSETDLAPALAAGALEQDVWWTTKEADQTVIWEQAPFSSSPAKEIFRTSGEFSVQSGPGRSLILHGQTETRLITFLLNGLTTITNLGPADTVFWPTANQPPLWIRGVELWTLDHTGQPQLLDRRSVPPQLAAWMEAPDIVTLVENQTLTIMSVSSRQGRGVILSVPLATAELLTLTADHRQAVVTTATGLQLWTW